MATEGHKLATTLPSTFEIPNPVEEFGQDGGHFYRCYDAMAKEIDDDMTSGLKEQLDGLLIFAGLFAGVNTAFLALTLPLMAASPADDTNALLLKNNALLLSILQGRNESIHESTTLPSSSFAPSKEILVVSILFALSLALALVSSFIAVLGRQWLVYYRKRGGGSSERQRLDQIDRFLGAEKWRLELVLDDILPSLLQAALVIFCVSLVIYLRTINSTLSYIICGALGVALAIVILTAVCAVWDRSCPFQSPLSRFTSWCIFILPLHIIWIPIHVLVVSANSSLSILSRLFSFSPRWGSNRAGRAKEFLRRFSRALDGVAARNFGTAFPSRQRGYEELHFAAIKRIICRSDDSISLLHAVASIFTMRDRHLLAQLVTVDELRDRFLALGGDIYYNILRLQGSDHTEAAAAGARLLDAALAHITLSIPDEFDAELAFFWWWQSFRDRSLRFPFTFSLHTLLIPSASPILLEAYLAYVITLREVAFGEETWLGTTILYYLEHWASPSWKTISLMAIAIASLTENVGCVPFLRRLPTQHDIRSNRRSKLRAAYVGANVESALASIEFALSETDNVREKYPNRDCQDFIFIRVFNSAHRAAFDEKGELLVEAEHVSKLMELTDRYLQTLVDPGISSNVGLQSLVNMLRIFQDTSMRLVACKSAPIRLLNHLVSIFSSLEKIKSKMVLGENDLEVLHAFGPIVQELFLLPDSGWRSHSGSYLTRSTPLDLDNDREGLRHAYDTFKLYVDRVSYTIKRGPRADRDPEVRWCHRLDSGNKNHISQVSGSTGPKFTE